MESFFHSLGVPTKIREYGIKQDELGDITKQLEAHGMTALSESGDLTLDIVEKILNDAY
jgi:NADP-dependent alcohol dehydrogenase